MEKMTLEAGQYTFTITFTDEGIVQDIFDKKGELVATQWEFYGDLGLQKTEEDSDFSIDEVDSIVAINILLNTYKVDVMKWTKEELQNMIRLLTVAITNPEIK